MTPDISAWPSVELAEPLAGGVRNPVFRAWRGSQELVVRVSSRPTESLEWELQLLRDLTDAGICMPESIDTADGRPHHDGVMVQRFLAGGPPRDQQDWRRVVAALATVHEVTVGRPQRPGFASAADLLDRDTGGDVDLAAMPADAAALVRASWRPVLSEPTCVIHGDLGARNVLITDERVALIDWDEARVDVPAFDYAHLPPQTPIPLAGDRDSIITAGVAWEAATCWLTEPDYAGRRLQELRSRHIQP